MAQALATSDELARVIALAPETLTGEDESDLRWYFRTGGLDVFSTSTFGSQLERAALFAFRGKECSKCKGSGFVPQNPRKWRHTTEHERELHKFLGKKARYLDKPFADRVCPKCQGCGWQVMHRRQSLKGRPKAMEFNGGFTARPTQSQGPSQGYDAGHVSMHRLGRVVSRLESVFDRDPMAVDVLAAFYGPEWVDQPEEKRARKASTAGIGGLFAVWPMTAGGKKLLRKNPERLFPLQLLTNEVNADRLSPRSDRKALMNAADEQALELIRGARQLWNMAGRS